MRDGQSSELRPGRVRDPVHGLVYFTSIERLILKHRVAQRLRYVAQSGLAHLVYPEVRTSRFSHSLGAMHLASAFLGASLKNAHPAALTQVCDGLRAAVQVHLRPPGPDLDSIDRALGNRGEPFVAHQYVGDEYKPYVRIVEQALRLGALFHDLGHLPFSHDFEHALEEIWRELPADQRDVSPIKRLVEKQPTGDKPHERLGHAVSLILLQDLFQNVPLEYVGAARITFGLAQQILESGEHVASSLFPEPNRADAALQWLSSLLAGDVDADRCDYVLRDGRNYGFVFAQYDLDRLIDNLVVSVPKGASDGGYPQFTLAIGPHGVSAAESFFLARFRSYQQGVRHHKVAQVGAALRYSIEELLQPPVAGRPNLDYPVVEAFLKDLDSIMATADHIKQGEPSLPSDREQLLNRFATYDDVWWTNLMRAAAARRANDEWLNLVCWRQSGPRSLWKWQGQFLACPSMADANLSLRAWNDTLPKKGEDDKKARWFEEVTRLEKEGVLVVRHTHSPWEAGEVDGEVHSRLAVEVQPGELMPLTKLSPLTRGLRDAWMEDIQVQAFATSTSALKDSADDVVQRFRAAIEG